ncbi:MAG: EpsI family protein [Capsulimonadales bacterium]|nr:EpsI family protein [Capsulimonadales bacterium]
MSDSGFRILVLLAGVAVLIGVGFFFARLGGEAAYRKGYPRPFGFLLGFYFTVIGLAILRGMKPNEFELRRRAEAASLPPPDREAGGAKESLPWDNLVYPGNRPNFRAAIVFLAIGCGLTWMLQFRPEDLGGRQATVRSVPYEVGPWKCVAEQTKSSSGTTLLRFFGNEGGVWQCLREQSAGDQGQDAVMQQLKADDYFMRTYVNQNDGHVVQLYLVYRRYGRREFNHNPDMCFPAGGYVLKMRDVADLPYAGRMAPAVHMTFDGSKVERAPGQVGVPETTVSYLFASGRKTEHQFLRQQLWMALERLLPNKNGWALLRLTTEHQRMTGPSTTEPISANEALSAQQDFMQAVGGEIEKAITTDATTEAPIVNADGTLVTP